ncbi:hypothetical protein QYF36_014135 [Acer negundo]|nr:hypothetical protein QYF36_014135 [Acer negundo]
MHVYGRPIQAKVADFGWSNRRTVVTVRLGRQAGGSGGTKVKSSELMEGMGVVPKRKVSNDFHLRRSFADVVEGKRNSGQKYPHKNGMVGEMGKSRQDNHAFAKYTTDQVDKILVDKGKGTWFKKARVKAVAIHDRSAKLDLDKRGRVAVEKVAAKSPLSTSFSSSNDSLIRWKGECSRRRESAGLQSPSLDQVLVAQPRLTSRSLSPAMDQLQVAHKCYSSMGLDNRVLKGSSEDRHSNNISQNTNFCPSEDDGFRYDRKDDFWTICEVSNGQVVVKQRNYDCVKNHIDQDFASVSAVPETNMREESLKDGEFDSDGLISDSNFGEDSLFNDFSMRDSHLLQDMNVVDGMQEGMMFLLGDKKANDLGEIDLTVLLPTP